MKPRRGKGTPHPKARRPLSDATNTPTQEHEDSNSPLLNLNEAHTQVARTLHKIDALVLKVHKLAYSKRLAGHDVQGFADALTVMNANLQDWNDYFEEAAELPSSCPSPEKQVYSNKLSIDSTPLPSNNFCSLKTSIDNGSISYSPLVPSLSLGSGRSHENELLVFTPKHKPEKAYRGQSVSPLSKTPCMPSPPRSVHVLSTIRESPVMSTPSDLVPCFAEIAVQKTPRSEDLLTPEHLTCHHRLMFETPQVQSRLDDQPSNSAPFIPQTPGFDTSPPRTCKPLRHGHSSIMSVEDKSLKTPSMPSPFRTPGIALRFNDITSESGSDFSPIIDDITESAVKRLSPRGLGERLWHELAIRKADVLKTIMHK